MSSPSTPALPLTDVDPDPFLQFTAWFAQARDAGVHEPEAMTLATASASGAPSARMVLLRGYGETGFVFFTNYASRKAVELAENPRAALVLHWAAVGRQIRVEGDVVRTDPAESDAYFASRPRGSQIGAWASAQSSAIPDRRFLEDEVAATAARFADGPVPRPADWGGYRLTPSAFEFWQHRGDRLHDRFRYELSPSGWSRHRLSP